LGIGDCPQSPIPNPQSPIPNPQYNFLYENFIHCIKKEFKLIKKNKNIIK